MSVAAANARAAELADVSERLDVPEGFRVEIIGGCITVSPAPQVRHAKAVRVLETVLRPALPPDTLDLQLVTLEIARTGERYVPDLAVLPESALIDDEWLFSAEACLLAAEVTAPSSIDSDRVNKPYGYGKAGIPLYLCVDAVDRTVTLFSKPVNGAYAARMTVAYGLKIHIPAPFDVIMDTAGFP